MKITRTAIIAITLLATSSFAVAGPGPQYWANLGKKTDTKPQAATQDPKDEKAECKDSLKAHDAAAGCNSCEGCQKKA